MRTQLIPLMLFAFAVRAGADEPVEKGKERWAVGTVVMPTKSTAEIQFGDWIDDKQEYFKMSGIAPRIQFGGYGASATLAPPHRSGERELRRSRSA